MTTVTRDLLRNPGSPMRPPRQVLDAEPSIDPRINEMATRYGGGPLPAATATRAPISSSMLELGISLGFVSLAQLARVTGRL